MSIDFSFGVILISKNIHWDQILASHHPVRIALIESSDKIVCEISWNAKHLDDLEIKDNCSGINVVIETPM